MVWSSWSAHHPEKLLSRPWPPVMWKMPPAYGWRGLDLPGTQDTPAGRWSPLIAQLGNMVQGLPFLGGGGGSAGLLGQQESRGLLTSKPQSDLGPDMPEGLKSWAEAEEEAPSMGRAQGQCEQWQGM